MQSLLVVTPNRFCLCFLLYVLVIFLKAHTLSFLEFQHFSANLFRYQQSLVSIISRYINILIKRQNLWNTAIGFRYFFIPCFSTLTWFLAVSKIFYIFRAKYIKKQQHCISWRSVIWPVFSRSLSSLYLNPSPVESNVILSMVIFWLPYLLPYLPTP